MTFAIPFPAIDPVLISFGPFAIRWYALAYIAGLLLGWRLMRRLAQWPPEAADDAAVDDFLVWATLGVVFGGRLGYVLFYNLGYYAQNPLSVFAVWQGGMSFHGGLLGVVAALVLFCRKRGLPLLPFADRLACVTPLGLFFGRVANFINGELFGRVTDVPWAMVFPRGGPEPRHPSQIYEALLEGALLLAVMLWLARRVANRRRAGFLTGAFLAGYGAARMVAELFRQPDAHLGFLGFGTTMGQWLSAPLLLAGCGLMVWACREGLADVLRRRIAADGPITVAEYMTEALTHPRYGYYMTGDPFGRRGDFITAPEVSQMFGELIGLWLGVRWQAMGRPDPVRLVELGPGRGTLMADALRAAAGVEGFAEAVRLHLIEVSPALRARQRQTLEGATVHPPEWHPGLADVPEGPMLVVANEFLDALPVHQVQLTDAGWRERLVGLDDGGGFAFRLAAGPPPAEIDPGRVTGAKPGAIAEVRPAARDLARALAERFQRHPGTGLVIDYGHGRTATGDTLQAVRGHVFQDPLADPGRADLSSHVDFAAFKRAARDAGAAVRGPVDQGAFLEKLGIRARADSLKKAAPGRAEEIDQAFTRLTSADGMGRLFKALSLASPGLPPPDGFD